MSNTPRPAKQEIIPFGDGKVQFRLEILNVRLSKRPWRWAVRMNPDGVPGNVVAYGKHETYDGALAVATLWIETSLMEKLRAASTLAAERIGARDREAIRLQAERVEAERVRGLNQHMGMVDDANFFPDPRAFGKTRIQTELMFTATEMAVFDNVTTQDGAQDE